jgi:hypothetical protein
MTLAARAALVAVVFAAAARAPAATVGADAPAAPVAATAVRWFRSDELGLALEPIPALRADEFAWVLRVERVEDDGGWTETRRLLSAGEERHRWTIVRSADGRTEEREERGGAVLARRLSGASGEPLQEESYEAGRLSSRSVYEYAAEKLVRVRVFAADGSLASSADYLTTPSGRLREVRWTAADGSRRTESQAAGGTSAAAGGTAVSEERSRDSDGWRTTRYDEAGRVAVREQGGPTGLVSRERLAYAGGSPTPVSSIVEWPGERRTVERSFDASGGAIAETTTLGDAVIERVSWTRDDAGRELVMRRTGSGGTVEVRSTWAADGTLEREEHFARGTRVKTVIHTGPGERVEELYADGELFLRVHYRGDERVREEVILDGNVVRERTLAP